MKQIFLNSRGRKKVTHGECSFFKEDFEGRLPSFVVGEMALVISEQTQDEKSRDYYYFSFNPFAKILAYRISNKGDINLVQDGDQLNQSSEESLARSYLLASLLKSYERKKQFPFFSEGLRLVSGAGDGPTGLIIDVYQNRVCTQLNTAFMNRFRSEIVCFLKEKFPEKRVVFVTNEEAKERENFADYSNADENESDGDRDDKGGQANKDHFDLEIVENSLKYKISAKLMQKNGYYYDHRENRAKLERSLRESSGIRIFKRGLDLFSYIGSWGLHALRAGVQGLTFVDQGDFKDLVEENLKVNGFLGQGVFIRQDVFSFLDQSLLEKRSFDLVICDPPAFKKSKENKERALKGYAKLYRKIFSVLTPHAMLACASCTQGINHDELDGIISREASKSGKNLYLLDIGIQSRDHSFSSLGSKNCYIKYLLYDVIS